MSSETSRGRFVWHELMASDPTAAQTFYPQLTGYSTKSWEGGSTPYTMWMNGDTAVGGPIQPPDEAKQQGAPPHWLAYIATADVDATAAAVLGYGGPWGVGEVSWYELATSDPWAAFDLFGWVKTDTMDMGAAGPYQMFGRTNERSVGGIFCEVTEMPGPPAWLLYLSVDDVDAQVETITKLGGAGPQ